MMNKKFDKFTYQMIDEEEEKLKNKRFTINELQTLKNAGISARDFYLRRLNWASRFFLVLQPLKETV